MRIDVSGGREGAVSQPLLNLLHRYAVHNHQAGTAVPKLVEAENRALLVVAESRICYNADRLWFCRSLFCIRRRGLRMARKSRKRQTVTLPHLHSKTAGYIRLSVTGKGGDDSIENQKKVIEAWARENQHPISRWYIDAGWSGRTFYKQEIQRMNSIIEAASLKYEEATDFSMKQYEKYVMGEGSKEAIAAARPAKEQAEAELNRAIADKEAYEKQYQVFFKLLKASRKEVPLSEIIDCIERIVVDVDRKIMVKWTE